MEYCERLPEIFGYDSKVISIGKTLQVNNIFYLLNTETVFIQLSIV